jgi:hypothetical protein
MNHHKFDNDAPATSDADYRAFVAWLSERTADELRQAKNNAERQKRALCRYYWRGLQANLTASELIDFLGVSSPSILDRAGYDEAESSAIMNLSDSLSDQDIERAGAGDVAS